MPTDRLPELGVRLKFGPRGRLFRQQFAPAVGEMKANQNIKIRQIADALDAAGYHSLDERARILDLPRSTTWSILKGNHKSSGLSSTIINRMLSAPDLPAEVRAKVLEYVEEKTAGRYGNSRVRLREFSRRLSHLSKPAKRDTDKHA